MLNASQDGPPDGYVTSAEACTRLRISDRTLRRRVTAGLIEGEYLPRPQGSVLYIKLPEDAAARSNAVSDQEAPGTANAAMEAASDGADATEPPALTTSLLEMVKADRETIATLYAENAAIREERGRLQAERDAAAARAQAAEAELQRLRARRWYDPRTW